MKSKYEIMDIWLFRQTKPIQTQFKANKAKNKPNLSQNKPNSNPIASKGKNDAKCAYTRD